MGNFTTTRDKLVSSKMRRQRWWLPLVALVFAANWKLTLTLPVPDEELDTSTKLLGSSVVTSVSIVTGSPDNVAGDNSMKTSTADRRRIIPSSDLPGSPADLMRPDKFLFYTLNKEGDLVTKQMTEQEIHGLIAAGGGHFPMEIHEPQKVGDVPIGEMKVADVVQNVQNVLKGELNKPATVMTSVPTIPGHVNTEWSSILPAILGGEPETAPASELGSPVASDISETTSVADTTIVKIPDSTGIQTIATKLPDKEPESSSAVNPNSDKRPPTGILETENHTEKPMIQIPVITVEQELPAHQPEEDSMPVFQMLNTISADKINAQNNTHINEKPKPDETHHEDTEKAQTVEEPQRLPVEPTVVKKPIVEQATIVEDKVPEMIEINYNSDNIEPSVIKHVIKPILKPESEIITSETISKLPKPESAATMTVISETHSTSMKVSGHEEIPLSKPPAPIIEPVDRIQEPIETKKPDNVTEKSTVISTIDSKLDSMTLKAEVTTEQPTDATTVHSLFSQGVSFFGNLPQTVSSIVSDLITNNSPSSTPIVEEAGVNIPLKTSGNLDESVQTSNSVKIPEPTKFPATTIALIEETVVSKKPAVNQEPVYQMMPEIIPDKKTPDHGTLPSEVSSIEHIIETLNDPTGSISGTIAADHFIVQEIPEIQLNVTKADAAEADTLKISNIPKIQTSTSATSINVETLVESSSVKPMEPLSTDLADSLTSMISQISDAMPSVLPLGQSAGLDTTEKKNVVDMNAEEPTAMENMKAPETQGVSETLEVSVTRVQLPAQPETENPAVVPTKVIEIHRDSAITTTADVENSTEKVKETSSTELPIAIPITIQSSNLDSSTTVKSAMPLASNESSELPLNRIDQVVAQKLEASVLNPEKSKPESDEIPASPDIKIDKVIPQAVAQESINIETVSTSVATVATPIEETSTVIPSTVDGNFSNLIGSIVSSDHTKAPVKVQPVIPAIMQEQLKLEEQKTEMPIKIKLNENDTELPIVRLDITGAKPTKFHKANESQPINNADHGAESPLVRIKLTDPVSLINSMIESSDVYVQPSQVVSLTLPETGSVPANNIASGLIAGFPSSTNSVPTVTDLNPDANLTSAQSVKSPPEVLILSDSPASNVTEDVKISDVKKSEVQVDNSNSPASNGAEDVKTSDIKKSEVQVENSNSPGSNVTEVMKTNDLEKSEVPVENITKPETQGLENEKDVTEKIDIVETSTSNVFSTAAPEIPVERIDFPKETVISDSSEKPAIAHIDSIAQMSTDKPRIEEPVAEITTSKSDEIEVSTTLATTASTPENQNTPTILVDNVTVISEEPTTTITALPIDTALENRIKISAPSGPVLIESDEKLNESSKINETAANTSLKPDNHTGPPESTVMKIQNSELLAESTNSTKPEVSDVVIDETPEKVYDIIPSKIQWSDVPIVETTAAPKKPLNNEGSQTTYTTQNSQSVTTMQSIIESSGDNSETSSNISLQATTVSTVEKVAAGLGEDTPTLENDAKESEKIETIAESILPEKNAEPARPISEPQKTEEIRIQVNNTAVLVTKRPVSDLSSQKLGDVTKSPENQVTDEQQTTPKVASVTEDPYAKLGEKLELPIPVKVSQWSSSDASTALDTSIKKDVISASGTETRIRLGEEQTEKIKGDKIPAKFDDTRKPIKKNSDGDPLSIKEKVVSPDSTTNTPSHIGEKISATQEKDSNLQLSTKVEIATSVDSSPIEEKVVYKDSTTNTPSHIGEKISATQEKDSNLQLSTKVEIATSVDSSPIEEKVVYKDSTTNTPSHISEKISVTQEKDSNLQLSTKVEIATNVSTNEPSNLANITDSIEVQEKPTEMPESATPIKVATEIPIPKPGKPVHKPLMNIKKDDAVPKPTDDRWTLIPQQVYPALTKTSVTHGKRPVTTELPSSIIALDDVKITSTERTPVSLDHPLSASGLDSTVKNLETDVSYFATLCNELAFTFWTATNKGLRPERSLAVSPFGMTSMLAMVFLGARGPTSDQMNDILKLDEVASFNPHLVFQNVTDAVGLARNQGVANAAFVRELFADKSKVRKLMPFYKEQAQQFYDGIVAEVNFATISDLVRRRTNLMIRKQTGGRIKDFVRTNTVPLRSPLAALSANVFQTDCNSSAASSEGRDGELYFAVSPAVRQRKLVPVPATVWRAGVLAGYEPSLDATAVALGGIDKLVSTIFVIPGQQGLTAPGDTLDCLEQRIIKGVTHDGSWNKLLKVLIPRPGLELQVPKFSHRSVINATAALKRMGLEELFSKHADLKGINGVATDLHLADVLQMNLFSTCGDENIISGKHHVEVYPASPLRNSRDYSEFEVQTDEALTDYSASDEDGLRGSALPYLPPRETRSARQNDATEKQRLKLDRPFLYFVRHNPTGLILHMGRFNPRLLP